MVGRLPEGRFQVSAGGRDFALPPSQAAQVAGMSLPDFEAKMAQATQSSLAGPRAADGSASSHPPIWQGRARYGHQAQVLSRNPDGTFQVTVDGAERTMTEPNVAFMTGLKKGPLYEMLGKATDGWISNRSAPATTPDLTDNTTTRKPLESRWRRKPLPKGADPAVAEHWRQRLESKRVLNPLSASEVFRWVEGRSFEALRHETERAAQTLLDLLPRDIIEKVGTVNVQLVKEIPGRVLGNYDANSNTLNISLAEYELLPADLRAEKMRELMWHEMGHWLYHNADAHPRLKNWKLAIRLHWLKRVQGQPIKTSPEGWRFIRDGWLSDYVGRLYHGWEGGVELPSVYLEEISRGPESIAYRCVDNHQMETFNIVTSIFGL